MAAPFRLLTFPIRTAVLFHTEGLEPLTVTAPYGQIVIGYLPQSFIRVTQLFGHIRF